MTLRRTTGLLCVALLLTGCVSADGKKTGRYGEGNNPSAHDGQRKGWPANPEYQRTRLDVAVQEAETFLHHGQVGEARRRLEELPPLELEDGRVHMLFARIAMAEGQPADVEWHLDEAGLLMPKEGLVDLMRATLREVYGDWTAARDAYAVAASKMPDDTGSITAQARVLLAMGSTGKAMELLEREMASRPLSGELLRTAGFVKLSAGLFEEAASDFRDAQDLLSPDEGALETMYLALARAGRYEDVVAMVRDVDIDTLPPLAQYTIGHCALLADEPGLAVEAFQHWITHDRSNPDSWLDLARAHFMDGQYDAAFEAVTKVLRVRPGHVDSLVLLGHIRSRVGQYAAAMATYRQAARLGADGVDLAPVMLRLVEVMERGAPDAAVADSDSGAGAKVVAFGGSRGSNRGAGGSGTGGPGAAHDGGVTSGTSTASQPLAMDQPSVDRRALAELMAGTRRTVAVVPEPVIVPVTGTVVPHAGGARLPELPDAGPAQEERMHALEPLALPLTAVGSGEG